MPTPEQQRLLDVIQRYTKPEADGDGLIPAESLLQGLSRRRFMQLLGASLALAGMEGCRATPPEEILPYTQRQPQVTPTESAPYATSLLHGGYAVGMLAMTREGRPIKLEGHPEHPASLGGSSAIDQAQLLSLYDPARAQALWRRGSYRSWTQLMQELAPAGPRAYAQAQGRGLHLLLEPSSSPWRGSMLDRLQELYPEMQVQFDPSLAPVRSWEGARRAFGRTLDVHHALDTADVIVALDADFIMKSPASLRYARELGRRRRAPGAESVRVYAIEPNVSVTGSSADHRLSLPASHIDLWTGLLWSTVASRLGLGSANAAPSGEGLDARARQLVDTVADDLLRHRGRCAIIVGERQPPEVHVLAHALNSVLDNAGTTTRYSRTSLLRGDDPEAYAYTGLVNALDAGTVDTLLVLGANPAYTAPHDVNWPERAVRAQQIIQLGLYEDETSEHATWFVPAAHPLESWGDGRAYDGTLSFIQPSIRPLYNGRQPEHLLAGLLGNPDALPQQMLREHWRTQAPDTMGSDAAWHEAVRRGMLPASASPPETVELQMEAVQLALRSIRGNVRRPLSAPENMEIAFALDPRVLDGRFANNAWLQELPEPVSKLVWDNAALIAPDDAERMGLQTGDMVELRSAQRSLQAPVFIQPGQAAGSLGMWLGHGRRRGAPLTQGLGVDVTPLRRTDTPWLTTGVSIRSLGRRYSLVVTQEESQQHDRPLALRRTAGEYAADPGFARPHNETPPSIYPDRVGESPQWGMAIDLNACTGCSACVVACQAENNIPVVGKAQVKLNREMHWLRIDRYYDGTSDGRLQVSFQPMLCQHCEKAPCEYVCPVNATVHSHDGLNEMVYNRCVGTRFCSNNCPYKIRHFNFHDWNDRLTDVEKMAKNPEVTVRARGVIEKCTFCVQRIRRTQIRAEVDGRPLQDMDVMTACQQACPSEAISFGDITDATSEVRRRQADERTYAVLNEIGTRPRVRYQARIDNLNPELEE